jgi:hypothetical protein
MVDFAVNPRKLVLINVDLQNAFVEGTAVSAPDGPELPKCMFTFRGAACDRRPPACWPGSPMTPAASSR